MSFKFPLNVSDDSRRVETKGKTMSTHGTPTVEVGDLVDAEYVEGIRGGVKLLRGIVISTGEREGQPFASVVGSDAYGRDCSTSSNSMPVHIIAKSETVEARGALVALLAAGRLNETRVAQLLDELAGTVSV